ncbi:shikimate dehydrogenase family protein [Sinisalibacter lacisalsi]|uniref:Shikimate dehydrogenase n=1 Tax=Sinisalibacter lacisalsi TaxID=1526570 RepID=A0ABQ1QFC9_9RHOB|nr:shikimate dehydrogenase [Sinisalibacter lacisalsi]GGD25198.1 shikimate dehydrogenase [Sinisalibacter lacisalsi]
MTGTTAKVQSEALAPGAVTGIVPNGETLVVPIVGDPIAQVKSPGLLTARFAAMGENVVVVPAHVVPAAFDTFMAGLVATRNVPGLVITVPHKQAALGHCAALTERARMAASVNVMRRGEKGWIGDNTDGMGYVEGILAAGGAVGDKRVLLIGAGGAGSAIAFEFLVRGAASLAIHEIDIARRDALIARLETMFPGRVSVGSADPTGFDIIANATPLGMRAGDPLPVEVDKLSEGQFAACPITRPARSPFIEAAAAKGCLTMPGLGMFKAQEGLLVDALLTLEADE